MENSFVENDNIQPSPLCGPTIITKSSVMVLLERNGSVVYNINVN